MASETGCPVGEGCEGGGVDDTEMGVQREAVRLASIKFQVGNTI